MMSHRRGSVISGKYELVELAGEGGMASVWKALDRDAEGGPRPVAVKTIRPEFKATPEYIAMFAEEARVGSELQHANIVQVYDFGLDDHGAYYLVMEWIDGLDLGHYVAAHALGGQRTSWPLMTGIVVEILRALSAAHERVHPDGSPAPVVHRDVSPPNILLGIDGAIKLSDFGLARAKDRIRKLTQPGIVKGKLSYLAPELTQGREADERTDLFAMGAVLWEALAGRKLFEGKDNVDIFNRIQRGAVEPLAPLRPDVPRALIDAVHHALEPDRAGRVPSARAMARELAAVLRTVPAMTEAQPLLGWSVVEARKRR